VLLYHVMPEEPVLKGPAFLISTSCVILPYYTIRGSMKKTKKTVGAVSLDLQQKEPESRDPIEIQRATEKDYLRNLVQCVEDNMKHMTGDFYVVVITKNERLLHNVFRCYFFARSSCPTPDYDQTVFLYKSASQEIEHIWTVPDRETSLLYIANKDKVVPEEYPLLDSILRFKDGTLFALCKQLNKEETETPLLAS
jgi:hypothetical protein